MDDYIGMIKLFTGAQPPRGWAFCQGQLLNVNTNQALFAILGTTYGGDGRNTFALPNLQGVTPLGAGVSPKQGAFNYGQKGGSENIPLTAANIPEHTHALTGSVYMPVDTDGAGTAEPLGAYPSVTEQSSYAEANTSTGNMLTTGNISGGIAGGGSQADKRMPFVVINHMICVTGYFPPRN